MPYRVAWRILGWAGAGHAGTGEEMDRPWVLALLGLLAAAACQPAPSSPARPAAPSAVPRGEPTAATAAPRAEPTVAGAPPALTAVRLGTLSATNDATYYLAQDRGYLREEGLE